jgi:integrase
MHIKSGKQVASGFPRRLPKNDTRYWTDRVFKPVNGDGIESPHYCVRIQFKGKRPCFTTGTGNKDAATRIARDVYMDLLTKGLEATLAARRPVKEKPAPLDRVASVGEYIAAVKKVTTVDAGTFGSYCRCLRSIVADIIGVEKSSKRFHHGNAAGYRKKIDVVLLDVLTPSAVQEWRIRFTTRANSNPMAQKRARISCNSVLRQARALFSEKVLPFITELKLPTPPPFTKAKLFKRESTRYVSKIDPKKLLQVAKRELADSDPEVFKAFLLALGTALRRGEIDKLLWVQIDFKLKVIHLEITEHGGLKSRESENDVPMDDGLYALLMAYQDKATGPFVIESPSPVQCEAEYGQRYRCEKIWGRLIAWLRFRGVDTPKPVHTLRKEAGSMVNKTAGIYAASRFLRHKDIQVSAAYYVDNKDRTVVDIQSMLEEKVPYPSLIGKTDGH